MPNTTHLTSISIFSIFIFTFSLLYHHSFSPISPSPIPLPVISIFSLNSTYSLFSQKSTTYILPLILLTLFHPLSSQNYHLFPPSIYKFEFLPSKSLFPVPVPVPVHDSIPISPSLSSCSFLSATIFLALNSSSLLPCLLLRHIRCDHRCNYHCLSSAVL